VIAGHLCVVVVRSCGWCGTSIRNCRNCRGRREGILADRQANRGLRDSAVEILARFGQMNQTVGWQAEASRNRAM
jgi:hypothetical protein